MLTDNANQSCYQKEVISLFLAYLSSIDYKDDIYLRIEVILFLFIWKKQWGHTYSPPRFGLLSH